MVCDGSSRSGILTERNEAKRHKHGQLPGDVCKAEKIAMRERKAEAHMFFKNVCGSFRRFIKERSITKQRQRDKKLSDERPAE